MNILAIYRHYWPDTTPYARLLRSILERLVAEGHTATVYTAQPSYNDIPQSKQPRRETIGGVHIRRVGLLPERKRFKLLRGLNFAFYLARAMTHVLLHRKYDLIVANTHPPVLMGAALRLIKRLTGTPYLLHCQDIHPESAQLAGQLGNGWLSRSLLTADTKNCRDALALVTLSRDMHEQLASRDGYSAENTRIINNFPLQRYDAATSIPAVFDESANRPFRVLFAGNMGWFQDLDRLIAAAHLLKAEPRIQFIFLGAGAARKRLVEQGGELVGHTVFFEAFQPVETAFACMQQSDLCVISLAADVFRVAYPSKTMTYLAAGCPVLALAERHSNLAEEIVANDFGYVPQDGTPECIARMILDAEQDRTRWNPEARAALVERSRLHFGSEPALEQWSNLISELEADLEKETPVPRVAEFEPTKAA